MSDEKKALAVVHGAQMARYVMTEEQQEIIRRQIAPPTASKDEVNYFIQWCQRTSLDPFIKQAWLVERKAKDASTGVWITKHEPMAAEAGMGAVAERQGDLLSVECDAVYEGDDFEMVRTKPGIAEVSHKWSVSARTKAGWKLIGAWAHVRRRDVLTPPVFLTTGSRIQTFYDKSSNSQKPTPFWVKDPSGQIMKCARALAYRLAYRDLFAGVGIPEEGGAGSDEPTPAPETKPGASRTDALLERLPKPDTKPEVEEAAFTETKPTEAGKPAEVRKFAKPTGPKPDPDPDIGPVIRWGKPAPDGLKGAPLALLSLGELENELAIAQGNVSAAKGNEPWLVGVRAGVAEIQARINELKAAAARPDEAEASIRAAPTDATERTPGEEG